MRLVHILNPVGVGAGRGLGRAQSVTLAAIDAARTFSGDRVEVARVAVFYPEDEAAIPAGWLKSAPLERSVLDLGTFAKPRKLPLLGDIFRKAERLIAAEDWVIYTNLDIAPMPFFYDAVTTLIRDHDAVVINRRTIRDAFAGPEELPMMYADIGEPHPGSDCFVLPAAWLEELDLDTVCLGAPFVGQAMLLNLLVRAQAFHRTRDEHLTFHIGADAPWRSTIFDDYTSHNRAAYERVYRRATEGFGQFDHRSWPGRLLVDPHKKASRLRLSVKRIWRASRLRLSLRRIF
jgi:hypothetical protein